MKPVKINKIIEEDTHLILDSLGQDISMLQGKNILIAGGTGFIGTYLLASLALFNDLYGASPCRIFILARNPDKLKISAPHLFGRRDIRLLSADVRTFKFPQDMFDFVIHAACPVGPNALRADRIGAIDIIVNGARNILEESVRCKAQRFLYISSGAVYGRQPLDLPLLPESYKGGPDIEDPACAYAEAKRYAEILCLLFNHTYGIPVVIARPFTFVGPYQDLDAGFAVTEFIRDGLRGQPMSIKGDGTQIRSYCYAADLAVALWKVLLRGRAGRAYNIGSQEPISILDLARRIIAAIGADIEVNVAVKSLPDRKPDRYIPDISRIKSELNFIPRFVLDESLARTIAWVRGSGVV